MPRASEGSDSASIPDSILDAIMSSVEEDAEASNKQTWSPYLSALIEALCPEDNEKAHATLQFPESNRTIRCNRLLLQVASPVFRRMFETKMKERVSGNVEIVEVDADMMETIIDFYKSGTIPEIEDIDHEAALHIIDRYEFDGFREAIASKLMDKATISDDVNDYKLVFTYYGSAVNKALAAKEIVSHMLKGNQSPTYVPELAPEDFFTLAKTYIRAVRGNTDPNWVAERTKTLLLLLNEWLSFQQAIDRTDERQKTIDSIQCSEVAVKILNIADLRGLDFQFISEHFVKLPVRKELRVFLEMLRSSLSSSTIRLTCQHQDCNTALACGSCAHANTHPFHTSAQCAGNHFCAAHRTKYFRNPHADTALLFQQVEPSELVKD